MINQTFAFDILFAVCYPLWLMLCLVALTVLWTLDFALETFLRCMPVGDFNFFNSFITCKRFDAEPIL